MRGFCDEEHELPKLARALSSFGHSVHVRDAMSNAKAGSDCFRALRHKFLVVRGAGEFEGVELIVEPGLRQHFAIPHPTPDYARVLAHVPEVFVGPISRLVPLVQLLCALLADSFEQQGLALPPWRRETAMLSKWVPNPSRCRDTPVTPEPPLAAGPTAPAQLFECYQPASSSEVIIARASSTTSTTSSDDVCSAGNSPTSVFRGRADAGHGGDLAAAAVPKGAGAKADVVICGFSASGRVLGSSPPGLHTRPLQQPLLGGLARLVSRCPTAGTCASACSSGKVAAAAAGAAATPGFQRESSGVVETRAPRHAGEMRIHLVKVAPAVQQ